MTEKQANADKIDAVYIDGFKAGYSQARFDLEQESCEDAISRQIISDYVGIHVQEINTGYGDLNKHTNEILRMIVDYIESMPPVTPQQKTGHWIPVSERLPEYGIEVLTCSSGGFIEIQSLEYSYGGYWENQKGDWSEFDEVIAWMPLPEPYKPQESEG